MPSRSLVIAAMLLSIGGIDGCSRQAPTKPAKPSALHAVTDGESWGYASATGELIVPLRYSSATPFMDGFAVAMRPQGEWEIVDVTGHCVVVRAQRLVHLGGGQFGAVGQGDIQLLDSTGRHLGTLPYDDVSGPYCDGRLAVCKDGRWGFIDSRLNLAVPLQFEAAMQFAEGLAGVRISGSWGYIDQAGKVAIAPQYYAASSFSEGRAAVTSNGLTWYIDRQGQRLFGRTFVAVTAFSRGVAMVQDPPAPGANGWRIMGWDGRYRTEARWDRVGGFQEGLAAVVSKSQTGYVDAAGILRIRTPPEARLTPFLHGMALYILPDAFVFIDHEGRRVLNLRKPRLSPPAERSGSP